MPPQIHYRHWSIHLHLGMWPAGTEEFHSPPLSPAPPCLRRTSILLPRQNIPVSQRLNGSGGRFFSFTSPLVCPRFHPEKSRVVVAAEVDRAAALGLRTRRLKTGATPGWSRWATWRFSATEPSPDQYKRPATWFRYGLQDWAPYEQIDLHRQGTNTSSAPRP
jgi:hypothetical protein